MIVETKGLCVCRISEAELCRAHPGSMSRTDNGVLALKYHCGAHSDRFNIQA